jgi:hypothetical protein
MTDHLAVEIRAKRAGKSGRSRAIPSAGNSSAFWGAIWEDMDERVHPAILELVQSTSVTLFVRIKSLVA